MWAISYEINNPHLKAQDNGTQKRTHRQPAQPQYRECLKNHAATLGAHATDGCGEFIASPASTPSDPSSLTCAACGCHRNFHHRVAAAAEDDGGHSHEQDDGEDEEDEAGSHVLLTLKTGGGGRVPGVATSSGGGPSAGPIYGGSMKRKRFRSKFSREQKEGMMELAERLGWRLQRRDEDVVDEGCRRIGVERGVFKVWMHNNKQSVLEMKRRDHHHHHGNNNNNNGNREENKVNGDNNCSSSSPSDDPN